MDDVWQETFLMHSKTYEFKEKVMVTNKVIEAALKRYPKTFVSFSGGKDSTVMLHLILNIENNTTVVHWDYGRYYIPLSIYNEIMNIARVCGAKFLVKLTSSTYEQLGRNAQGILGKHFIGIEIPKLIKQGYRGCFIGLRAEESCKRKSWLKEVGFYEEDKRGIINIYPLKDWTWKDIWAYIISRKLPYLSFYDIYAPLQGYDKTRFVTLFDSEFNHLGAMNVDGVLMWRFKHI